MLLFLGRHVETITTNGFHLRLPLPLMTRDIVNYSEQRNEDFGFRGKEDGRGDLGWYRPTRHARALPLVERLPRCR